MSQHMEKRARTWGIWATCGACGWLPTSPCEPGMGLGENEKGGKGNRKGEKKGRKRRRRRKKRETRKGKEERGKGERKKRGKKKGKDKGKEKALWSPAAPPSPCTPWSILLPSSTGRGSGLIQPCQGSRGWESPRSSPRGKEGAGSSPHLQKQKGWERTLQCTGERIHTTAGTPRAALPVAASGTFREPGAIPGGWRRKIPRGYC